MSEERLGAWPLRYHLAALAGIVVLLATIAMFLVLYPMDCPTGARLVSSGYSLVCAKGGAG